MLAPHKEPLTRIESRTPGDTVERLLHLARELIALRCDVIFATSPNAIRAATNATATLRIVGIDLESDPVVSGWAKEPRPPWRNFTSTFLDLPPERPVRARR